MRKYHNYSLWFSLRYQLSVLFLNQTKYIKFPALSTGAHHTAHQIKFKVKHYIYEEI
jgi:hypothetical protein